MSKVSKKSRQNGSCECGKDCAGVTRLGHFAVSCARAACTGKISAAVGYAFVAFAAVTAGSATVLAAYSHGLSEQLLAYGSVSPGRVLGTYVDVNAHYMVSNASLRLRVGERYYSAVAGRWEVEVAWRRTLERQGSVYITNIARTETPLSVPTADRQDTVTVQLRPSTRYRVEFFKQPNREGGLLARKFFTTSPRPAANQSDTGTGTTGGTTQGSVSLRYLRVQTTVSRSWVAWREIEVYDQAGAKLTPAGATASATWRNYPGNAAEHAASFAIDGNPATVWNAGETAPNCNWFGVGYYDRIGCGIGGQSAWIDVDLGSVKQVTKVRLLTENSPSPAAATHRLLAKGSSGDFQQIYEFTGNIRSSTWLEFLAQNRGQTQTVSGS